MLIICCCLLKSHRIKVFVHNIEGFQEKVILFIQLQLLYILVPIFAIFNYENSKIYKFIHLIFLYKLSNGHVSIQQNTPHSCQ